MCVANAVLEEDHSYVCKFREINEKFLSLLPKLEIYIPTVAQLNDPLEGVLTEGYAVSCNPPPGKSDVESYLQTVGVYSVSIHKQKWHGSNFFPMWASYANIVQAWVAQQHATMSVQPWFTPEVKARIPDDFLPPVPLP